MRNHMVIQEGVENLFCAVKGHESSLDEEQSLRPSSETQRTISRARKKKHAEIICIPKTESRQELAAIYTAADFFVNPSREETFGMTTLEAITCGTTVIVYKGTACEEVVLQSDAGERSVQ